MGSDRCHRDLQFKYSVLLPGRHHRRSALALRRLYGRRKSALGKGACLSGPRLPCSAVGTILAGPAEQFDEIVYNLLKLLYNFETV